MGIKLNVSASEASKEILSIPHKNCSTGMNKHWRIKQNGIVKAQSVLWLFCWAKTGQNSGEARRIARKVFNDVLSIRFEDVDSDAFHEYARRDRYAVGDIESEFERRIANA